MPPLFSIITVTYNAERVLERTLRSVCDQSYRNIEYILVDGASTDGTIRLATAYRDRLTEQNKRFELVSEPDKGLYDAMNKGLRMATGDYVWFLNAGDMLQSPDTVARLAEVAQRHHLPDILYGETDVVDEEGKYLAARRLKAPEHLTWKSFRMGMLVCHQAFVMKREAAPEYDLQYRFSADFDWCIRCMKQSAAIVHSHLRLVHYLAEGMTTRNRKASLKERYRIMCNYYGTFPTQIRHVWFAFRFYRAKLFGNNY